MTGWVTLEGETPIDPSGLKHRGSISNRAELAAAEARNVSKAFLKYVAARPTRHLAPFDEAWLLTLHAEMYGDVWTWAGQIRSHNVNIGIPHYNIREQLLALTEDAWSWIKYQHALADQAVLLHHRAVHIHPFENGNGRWARLLANIWLRLHDAPLVAWPDNVIGVESEIRQEYLAAVKAADAGRYGPLTELHTKYAEPIE